MKRDLRIIGEALAVIVVGWLLLGWTPSETIAQADGTFINQPYLASALAVGGDWTEHLYRFAAVGGSEMHAIHGTTPLVQACAIVGLSPSTTANVITMFLQLCFAVFGLAIVEAVIARAAEGAQRVLVYAACGFAPVLGWRLGIGHENLILGLLPFVAALALFSTARTRTPSPIALAFAAFATAVGVTDFGAQTVLYCAVVGLPLFVVAVRGVAWGRAHWLVLATLAGACLIVLPRVVVMFAHVGSDDAARTLGANIAYAYSGFDWLDLARSLAWTREVADQTFDLHERNYPVGPLLVLAIAWWPSTDRRPLWAALIGCGLALALALNLAPISTVLFEAIPPLEAFRVPARALLPILVVVPMFALAGMTPPKSRRMWIAIALAAVFLVVGHHLPGLAREALAWILCIGLVALRRIGQLDRAELALPVVVALGMLAFAERLPDLPRDTIDGAPRSLRTAVLEHAPELAMPLHRVQMSESQEPWFDSIVFAAGLGGIDGVWVPPRRFFALYGALLGTPVHPTTSLFAPGRSRAFPIFQQLYNVRYSVAPSGRTTPLPTTNGPASFVDGVAIASADTVALAWRSTRDVRADLKAIGWFLPGDPQPTMSPECRGARVERVDASAQTARIAVVTPAACILVVATTYVSTLRAHAGDRALSVFPIDIALTGIAVPAGTTTIMLAPEADVPWWSIVGAVLGALFVLTSLVLAARARTA